MRISITDATKDAMGILPDVSVLAVIGSGAPAAARAMSLYVRAFGLPPNTPSLLFCLIPLGLSEQSGRGCARGHLRIEVSCPESVALMRQTPMT